MLVLKPSNSLKILSARIGSSKKNIQQNPTSASNVPISLQILLDCVSILNRVLFLHNFHIVF